MWLLKKKPERIVRSFGFALVVVWLAFVALIESWNLVLYRAPIEDFGWSLAAGMNGIMFASSSAMLFLLILPVLAALRRVGFAGPAIPMVLGVLLPLVPWLPWSVWVPVYFLPANTILWVTFCVLAYTGRFSDGDQQGTWRPLRFFVGYLLGSAVLSVAVYFGGLYWSYGDFQTNRLPTLKEHRAKAVVHRLTGIELSEQSRVDLAVDDHGGLLGDGTLQISISLAPGEAQAITQTRTLVGPWQFGFVPQQDRAFRHAEPSALSAKAAWFAAEERCCEDLRWHNGSVLAVSHDDSRLFLGVWDY